MKKPITFKLKAWLSLVLLFVFGVQGYAQLSGIYTIDSALATGGTNYQTFTAAVTALTTNGVNGAVTFNVKTGTYSEQISIPNISGASSINTITFSGLGDVTKLTAAPTSVNLPVLNLDSTSHVTIDNLKIEVTGSLGWGVHFMNYTDSVTINNCHIVGPALSGIYGILASGSVTATSAVQPNAQYVTITNNNIEGCHVALQMVGMTGPVTVPSKKVNYSNNATVTGNTITDFRTKGIIINNYHNVKVSENTITTSSINSNGAVSFWDAGDNLEFTKNKVFVASNMSNTRVVALAMAPANGPAGDSTLPGLVANNFIQYRGSNSTTPTGLLLKNKAYIKVYNNTIRVKNQGATANCIWIDANNTRAIEGIELRNNNLNLENAGTGYFIYGAAQGKAFKNMVIDHNNFYAPSAYFKNRIQNGITSTAATYNSLSAYKANTYGWATGALNVDPGFISLTDLHASSAAMNDSAAVINMITTDIDGDVRSLSNPDIGADEYTPPTCLVASGLGVTNLVSTSADLYWTQSNLGSTFKVQHGVSGFTLGSGTSNTPSNDTVSISGLTAQTTYDFYVMEVCSATDSSAWTGPFTFVTPCATISTYPYTENFEGTGWTSGTGSNNAGDAIDACWSRWPSTGTSVYKWGNRTGSTGSSATGPSSAFGGTGNYMFTEGSYGASGAKTNLTSPTLDLSSLNNPQVTFQYHMYGAAMGSLSLWVWNGSAYDTVWTRNGNQGNKWEEGLVDLSNYKNQIIHFKFHAKRGTSYSSDLAIDELTVGEAPACPKVSSVSLSNPTASSVTSNFISGGTKFIIEYGPTGFIQGTGLTDTALATGHITNGLVAETVYDFYFQNNCIDSGNGSSLWVGPYTIKTLCAEVTGLYFNNWDHLANNTADFCWSLKKYGTGTPTARAYDPSASVILQPKSGDKYYRYYNSSNHDSYLISPAITYLDSNLRQLRFWGASTYSGTKSPIMIIGTMLSPSDTGSFTAIDTLNPAKNTWNEYIVLLNNIPAGHKHVVIRNATVGNYVYLAMDDFRIEYMPACIAPSAGIATNITPTEAVLNWTAGSGTSWKMEYGVSGFVQGTGMVKTTTSTTDTLTGLTAQTCYDVYIQDDCGSNQSPWYGPVTFCTPCSIITAPFVENFDAAPWVPGTGTYSNGDVISDCWSRNPSANSTHKWAVRSGSTSSTLTGPDSDVSGSGNYLYTEASVGTNGHNALLFTPVVDFSSLANPTFSFSYHMYGATSGSLWVTIENGGSYDTLWTIAGEQHTSGTAAFTKVYVDISAYKNTPSKIRIVGKRGLSYSGDMAIDEVSIAELPSCLMPNAFVIDSTGSTVAGFSWASLSGGTSFKLEFGAAGFTQGTGTGTTVYTSGSPTLVSGLNVNTNYDIYLADMCDSTTWVGPITFTTLIDYDIQMQSLVSPSNLDCGDSSYIVEVKIKNNGLLAATGIPVNVDISNGVLANISTVYNTPLAPGASAIINVGTFNNYNGGHLDVSAYSGYTLDQNNLNDSLSIDSIEIISFEPQHLPTDTLCKNDTNGYFVALPQTDIVHNWYANMNDTIPMASGDSLPAMPGQTVYLDRSKESDQMLFNASTGSHFGNMMRVYIKNDIWFTGFTFENAWNGNAEGIAFYKQGNWEGFETNVSAWTPIDSVSFSGAIINNWYKVNFANPVKFNAGDTISLYLANKNPSKVKANAITSVDSIGDVYISTADFDVCAGRGGAYFGSNMANQTQPTGISVTLHWESNAVCGNSRIPVSMGINQDTAVASFVHAIDPNGADVSFDASTSNGQVYTWDFGDGNSGSGMLVNHTYANGTYQAKLIVTDTVCGTIDSMLVMINATVGISESLLGRTLNVYPNPNSGEFRLDFELEGIKHIELEILDEIGRVVYTEALGNVSGRYTTQIDLSGFAQGVYLVKLNVEGKTLYKKVSVLR